MALEAKGDFELNYVYTPKGSEEFLSVNVVLKVMKKKINLNIHSDEEIEPEDLKLIVEALKKKIISKTGIDIQNDCLIYLFVKDNEYYVESEKELKVYKLLSKG